MAIPMGREVDNINFSRVWYNFDLSEVALHRSSERLSAIAEGYLIDLSSGGF